MKVVAHRGNAPGYAELTRAAFENTLAMPIHGVECDVRLCASGELVVHHDQRIGRTAVDVLAAGPKISTLALAELREFNVGSEDNPQCIMTLDELLELIVDAGDKHLYLEIKHPTRFGRITEEQVVRSLTYAGLIDDPRIHIISFSNASMRRMRQLAPHIDRFYLRRQWELRYNPKDIRLSAPTGLGLSVNTARVRPDLVGAGGLPTYMWTANSRADLEFAHRVGADIVATDNPALALDVCSELASVH
ncbi:glycerophosphodiester phosphodiesterase family protein [Corynebacterium tapiri]|uniref:Glycerophosphodiester phosphodiesterase n=1 Tax=Corynebacterium tapiri TaxID=1448266 RepID=A0A5C4U214_9CORY|nr:glycerophosphodiester phosphodiesterase family protein [Corynebacterium tapiri]TNL94654.1 glycerophosphodiester phosphodiesterase [Corynebacterium tapiri]